MNQRFLLNREQAKVMGVAAGLADYTGVDALVIRLGLIIATLIAGPVTILLYVLTGWLAADR
jgi:phage shock protein C